MLGRCLSLCSMALVLIAAWLAAGCSANEREQDAKSETPGGTMGLVLDHVTGRAQVQAGREAMNTIREVSAERDRNLNEVLEGDPGNDPAVATE